MHKAIHHRKANKISSSTSYHTCLWRNHSAPGGHFSIFGLTFSFTKWCFLRNKTKTSPPKPGKSSETNSLYIIGKPVKNAVQRYPVCLSSTTTTPPIGRKVKRKCPENSILSSPLQYHASVRSRVQSITNKQYIFGKPMKYAIQRYQFFVSTMTTAWVIMLGNRGM